MGKLRREMHRRMLGNGYWRPPGPLAREQIFNGLLNRLDGEAS